MSESDKTNIAERADDGWDHGWEEHRRRQMQRFASLPFAAKLQWLEEAEEIAMNLAASRKAQQKASAAAVPKET